jgi:hypothetical protein
MITQHWKTRRSAREFTEQQVDYTVIQDIIDIIPAIPAQNGYVDHWWVVFGPEDFKCKEWLVDNIYNYYHNDHQKTEYFTGLITAPYVFHSFKINPRPDQTVISDVCNNSFHAGVIVSQAVDKGLDTAPIACMDGWTDDLKKDYRDLIWEKFGPILKNVKQIYHEDNIFNPKTIVRPMMSIGIGHRASLTVQGFKDYKDGVTARSKAKQQKAMENVSVWN